MILLHWLFWVQYPKHPLKAHGFDMFFLVFDALKNLKWKMISDLRSKYCLYMIDIYQYIYIYTDGLKPLGLPLKESLFFLFVFGFWDLRRFPKGLGPLPSCGKKTCPLQPRCFFFPAESVEIFEEYPPTKANEGLSWNPLFKHVCHPGGDWNLGWGVDPRNK